MKISTDPDSPYFHSACSQVRVFLAGAERNNVLFADEEGRTALQMRLNEWGNPVHDAAGLAILDRFWGDVRVEAPLWVRVECERRDNPPKVSAD